MLPRRADDLVDEIDALGIRSAARSECAITPKVPVREGQGLARSARVLDHLTASTVGLGRLGAGRMIIGNNLCQDLAATYAAVIIPLVEHLTKFMKRHVPDGFFQ